MSAAQTSPEELLAEIERGVEPADVEAWHDELAAREGELSAALEHFLNSNDAQSALRLTAGLQRFWMQRGRFADGRRALERALAAPGADAATPARAAALAGAGMLAFRQGANDDARRHLDESLAIARRLGDRSAEAIALNGLSRVALRDGEYGELRRLALESKAIAEELGDRRALASPIHMLRRCVADGRERR